MKYIYVFGGISAEASHSASKLEDLGKQMITAGFGLVCGAENSGLLKPLIDEMLKADGEVIGVITPEDKAANRVYIKVKNIIEVANDTERRSKLWELSEASIALPGGFETFDEIAALNRSNQAPNASSRLLCLFNYFYFFRGTVFQLDQALEQGFLDKNQRDRVFASDSTKSIIERISNYHRLTLNNSQWWLEKPEEIYDQKTFPYLPDASEDFSPPVFLRAEIFAHLRNDPDYVRTEDRWVDHLVAVVDCEKPENVKTVKHAEVSQIISLSKEYFATISAHSIKIWDSENFSEKIHIDYQPKQADSIYHTSHMVFSAAFKDPYIYVLMNSMSSIDIMQCHFFLYSINIQTQETQKISIHRPEKKYHRDDEDLTPGVNFFFAYDYYVIANKGFLRLFKTPLTANSLDEARDVYCKEIKGHNTVTAVMNSSSYYKMITHDISDGGKLAIWQWGKGFDITKEKEIVGVRHLAKNALPDDHVVFSDAVSIRILSPMSFAERIVVKDIRCSSIVSLSVNPGTGQIAAIFSPARNQAELKLYTLQRHFKYSYSSFFRPEITLPVTAEGKEEALDNKVDTRPGLQQ